MAGRPGGCDPTRGAPRAHNSFLNSPLSPFAAFRHPCRNMPNIHRNVLVAAHCDVGVSWAALWPQSGGFCAGVLVPAVPEAVGRRRARLCGGVAPQGLGGCSTDDVHRQQLDQLPPVVLRPVRLDDVPPTTKPTRPHISPVDEGVGWLSRVGRDRLGRCFLHAASYNVIITASIPRELPQHLESQLEWGEWGGRGNAMGRSTRTQRQLKKYNFVNFH